MPRTKYSKLALKERKSYLTVECHCCEDGRCGFDAEELYEAMNKYYTLELADVKEMANRMATMPGTDQPIKKVGNKYHKTTCTGSVQTPKEIAKLIC